MSRRKGQAPAAQPKKNVPRVAPPMRRDAQIETNSRTSSSLTRFEAEFFEGPLPHPDNLAEYDRICPGAASRILAMAESQALHRQELEKLVIASNCRSQDRGPILGFLLAAGVISIGAYLILQGKETSGLVALVAALAAVVIPFLYGKREQKKDLQEKEQQEIAPRKDD